MSRPKQAQKQKKKSSSQKHSHTYKLRRIDYWLAGIGLLVVLLAGQVAWQLSYPNDTAPLHAKVFGEYVGGMSRVAISSRIQQRFYKASVELVTATATKRMPLVDMGASIDADRAAARVTDYSTLERLVPFSIMLREPQVTSFEVSFQENRLTQASNIVSRALTSPPRDAGLAIVKGKLTVTASKVGETVQPSSVSDALKTARFHTQSTRVAVATSTQQPLVLDADVAPIKAKAEAAIARTYTLLAPNGTSVTPSRSDIAAWLTIRRSGASYSLATSAEALRAYSQTLNKQMGKAATPTVVRIVNGSVASRRVGAPGSVVNTDDLVKKLQNAVASSEQSVAMDVLLRPSPSPVQYATTYTSSQEGLAAYVSDVTSTQNIRIAVRQLDGNGWSAFGRANESTVSASTYKLYVSLWLFDQMDKGKIHWDDPWLDTTVSGCFDRMTIASTNPCAQAWISEAGRTNLNNFIYNHGFSQGTTFTHPEATHTTANDLLKFMTGLQGGTLIGGAHRDRLFHSLSVHPYRSGVPAGSAGTVKNKVGFLWDYVNDAAVVRHPKGTYVIVVMTKGYSYAKIAEITRQIERIMYG